MLGARVHPLQCRSDRLHFQLYSEPSPFCAGEPEDPGNTRLAFDAVCLTYPGRRVPALDNVSFAVPPGRHFGICGRTGAGKSSILTALFQLSPLQKGAIRVGNVDLSQVSTGYATFLPIVLRQCSSDPPHLQFH